MTPTIRELKTISWSFAHAPSAARKRRQQRASHMLRQLRFCVVASMTALVWFLLSARSQAAEVDRFLPGDTEIIVHVNLRQALGSDLVKKYALEQIKTPLKQSAELQAVLTAAGVDPIKDITSLTLAAPGKINADSGLVIVRGNFDADKFHKAAADFADKNPESLRIHKAD